MNARADAVARRMGTTAKKCVVAGGLKNHVRGTISENLASVGIEVVAHWDDARHCYGGNGEADFILLLADSADAPVARAAKQAANLMDIHLVEGSRKWARLSQALIRTRWIKPEALASMRALPDPIDIDKEPPVPDKPPAVDLQVRDLPSKAATFADRAALLKSLIGAMFETDGIVSLIATRAQDGSVKIEADRRQTVTL